METTRSACVADDDVSPMSRDLCNEDVVDALQLILNRQRKSHRLLKQVASRVDQLENGASADTARRRADDANAPACLSGAHAWLLSLSVVAQQCWCSSQPRDDGAQLFSGNGDAQSVDEQPNVVSIKME